MIQNKSKPTPRAEAGSGSETLRAVNEATVSEHEAGGVEKEQASFGSDAADTSHLDVLENLELSARSREDVAECCF